MEHFTINTKHTDGSLQHGSAENNHNNNSTLVDIEPVPGTPFALVREGEKHFLVMGDHKLSPDLKSKEEVEEYYEINHWLILTNVVIILVKRHEQLKEIISKQPYETTSL